MQHVRQALNSHRLAALPLPRAACSAFVSLSSSHATCTGQGACYLRAALTTLGGAAMDAQATGGALLPYAGFSRE